MFSFGVDGRLHCRANASVHDEVNRNEIGVYLAVGVGQLAYSLHAGRHEGGWSVHVGDPTGLGVEEGRGYHPGSDDAGGNLSALSHYRVLRPSFR